VKDALLKKKAEVEVKNVLIRQSHYCLPVRFPVSADPVYQWR
jgi:hypothetical protein